MCFPYTTKCVTSIWILCLGSDANIGISGSTVVLGLLFDIHHKVWYIMLNVLGYINPSNRIFLIM